MPKAQRGNRSNVAAPIAYVGPELNEEQRERKKHLLSRFRHFAKEWQGSYYSSQPHDEMADEMDACTPNPDDPLQRKKVYLAPRYTYKTSLVVAFMAYLILKWMDASRDIAIDYIRSDYEIAADVLYELKQNLQTQEFILELWGDLSQAANVWAEGKIQLGKRRDPTVNVSGLNRGTAGKHPDIVIADDMVNEKNFESIKAKRSARQKVQAYSPVLPPWGSFMCVGTRFAHNDTYGWILEKNDKDRRRYKELLEEAMALPEGEAREKRLKEAAKFKPQWTEYIRSVKDASGNLFFPDVITEEFLEQQKRSIEAKFYAAWYLNRPDVEGMQRFRLEYLSYFTAAYSRYPIPIIELVDERGHSVSEFPVRVTMTIDPTLTASGTSDWTGITLVATDAAGDWWVMIARRYLEVPSVVGDEAVKLIRKYLPTEIEIESAMADVEMVSRIQKAIIEENLPCVIRSYNPLRDEVHATGRRKKAARIEALEPRFRNGRIHLHRNTCEALYDQYRQWPDVDHDDVFDALAMQWSVAKPCQYKTVEDARSAVLTEDDPEEAGKLWADYQATLTDVDGNLRRITVPMHGEDEPMRGLGRAGLSSQRRRSA